MPHPECSLDCRILAKCPSDTLYCDYSSNDPLLWKAAPYTWNPSLMLSDLPEGDLALRMVARDSCSAQNLSIEYTQKCGFNWMEW
jgi:hypothetical protein